jgi:DNA invertase Pin-like site-specific DNA recombinase
LEVQQAACAKWAKANKHQIVAVYRDEGISGSNGLETRLGLADALRAIKDGEVKGLVVYRLDRLARDLIVQETLIADIRRMGGQLFTTSPSEAQFLDDDPDDPSRKLIRQILGAVSEYERAMIALRLRSGRKAKAAKGGFAFGAPPLGFRAENGSLVAADEEQAVLDRIAALRASGASFRTICGVLASEGYRPKRGTRWHPATVARVVNRQARRSLSASHSG